MDSVKLLAQLDACQEALDSFRSLLVGGNTALPIVSAFVLERCDSGPNLRAKASDLIAAFEDYATFADDSLYIPTSVKALCMEFAKLARRKRTSAGTVYLGIALKSD